MIWNGILLPMQAMADQDILSKLEAGKMIGKKYVLFVNKTSKEISEDRIYTKTRKPDWNWQSVMLEENIYYPVTAFTSGWTTDWYITRAILPDDIIRKISSKLKKEERYYHNLFYAWAGDEINADAKGVLCINVARFKIIVGLMFWRMMYCIWELRIWKQTTFQNE